MQNCKKYINDLLLNMNKLSLNISKYKYMLIKQKITKLENNALG